MAIGAPAFNAPPSGVTSSTQLSDSSNLVRKDAANTITAGGQVVGSLGATSNVVPLTVQMPTGGSVDIFDVKFSNGVPVFYVGSDSNTYVNANLSVTGNVTITSPGSGIFIKEGANALMGTLTLNGATEVTVNTTAVSATSRIFLTVQVPGGTPAGVAYVSSRVNGTSFGVKGIALDTSTVAWLIIQGF